VTDRDARRPARSYLHALLGLRSDATVAQLRWAYERAMAAATRSGDAERARALSQAYDGLPAEIRHQVYATGPATGEPVSYPPRPTLVRRPDQARPRPRPPRRRTRLSRLLLYLVVVPAAVVAGIAYHSHYSNPQTHTVPAPRRVDTPRDGAQPVSSPAPQRPGVAPGGHPVNQRVVPLDAPTDGDGFVTVICTSAAEQLGYTQYVRPGTTVSCNNGAVPQVGR
jgi:hypothetical protein